MPVPHQSVFAVWMPFMPPNQHRQSTEGIDSFLRRKLENRSPILSLLTISFELHAKMVEEIDLENCNFRKFRIPVTLTLDWVEVILMCIFRRGLPTYRITSKSEELFVNVRLDGWTHLTSVSLLGHRLASTLPVSGVIAVCWESSVEMRNTCLVFTARLFYE